MKIAIITLDKDKLVRYAENFMRELVKVWKDDEGPERETEIIIHGMQSVGYLLSKFSDDDILIWYDPKTSNDELAKDCSVYAKNKPERMVFYIHSCNLPSNDSARKLIKYNMNVCRFGLEQHHIMAQKIRTKFLRHIIDAALLKHPKHMSVEDFGTPAD